MEFVNAVAYFVAKGDLNEWQKYATTVLGMQDASEDNSDRRLFRMDERAYRIVIEPGVAKQISIGLETTTEANLDRCVASLRERGYEAVEDEKLAKERLVRRLVRSIDPSGNGIELVYGQQSASTEFISPRGTKFVAGDMGFGHVFLMATDWKAMVDYYVNALGFMLSDTIGFAKIETDGIFLHCNERHHSIAFAQIPGAEPGVQHIMLETDSLDSVGYALDQAEDWGDIMVSSLGRHTNDRMTSFYMKTPSGFQIEYGTGGRTVVDGEWVVGHYTAVSSWGHRPVTDSNIPVD